MSIVKFLRTPILKNMCERLILSEGRGVSCQMHALFIRNSYNQRQTEIDKKNQVNAKQQPDAELLLIENYSYSSSTLLSKNNDMF